MGSDRRWGSGCRDRRPLAAPARQTRGLLGWVGWCTGLCAGLWIGPCFAQGAAAPVIGEVLALKGEAWADGQVLRPGDPLQAGMTLRTGQGGRLRLRFEDGSVLVIAEHSELYLERYERAGGARQASLWLPLGLIGQSVRPQAGGRWQVRTPSAVTAVRGTAFMVEAGEGHKAAVLLDSGEVAVEPLGGLRLRGASPPTRQLNQPGQGTDCDAETGCGEVRHWPEQRVKVLRDRLAF